MGCTGDKAVNSLSDVEPEEPLIPAFHSNIVPESEQSIQVDKAPKKVEWNENNPFPCVTLKPTMYVKDEPKNVGSVSKFKNGTTKDNIEGNIEANNEDNLSDNIEIFEKLKTIEEDDEENENCFLVKNSKTLYEYAYKKVDISDKNDEAALKILKEVDILKKINHPNVIKLFEATISKDNKYIEILTEFSEEGDLQSKIEAYKSQNKHFPESLLIDWLNQILMALKFLHSQNILHRNIRPACIFLMKPGFVKLGDFGMAKTIGGGGNIKRAKTIIPKLHICPPEIIEKNDYTTKTDIWYLGTTFFKLMTFKFPFKGENDTEIIQNILAENKNDYTDYSYSDNFKELINRMISKDPSNRPNIDEILNMDFIQKRMESYIQENDKEFVKAQNALDLFEDLEEIETVKENIDNDGKEKKVEIRIVEKEEEKNDDKKEEVKEEEEEKEVQIEEKEKEAQIEEEEKEVQIEKEEKEVEIEKEEKNVEKKVKFNEQIEEIGEKNVKKRNKNIEKKLKPGKTRVEKNVRFNIDEEALKKKNQRKKEKKQALDFVRQLTYMKELMKK